jgi:hypothetical protein
MKIKHFIAFVLGFAAVGCGVEAGPEEPADQGSLTSELQAGSNFIPKLRTKSVSYAGSVTPLTPSMSQNDAIWFVNMPDSTYGDVTKLNATITHGGLLNGPYGLDHLVVGIRGLSVEQAFQQMGKPIQTGTFLYGEEVAQAVQSGQVTIDALNRLLSGRGITFWAVGSTYCQDKSKPCAIFENYTVNGRTGDGLACKDDKRDNCQGATAVALTSGSFQLNLTADDWDMRAVIIQSGKVVRSISCRAVTTNTSTPQGDPRCGAQPADVAYGDAFIGNVVHTLSFPVSVGATNIQVSVGPYPGDTPACPTCPLPLANRCLESVIV